MKLVFGTSIKAEESPHGVKHSLNLNHTGRFITGNEVLLKEYYSQANKMIILMSMKAMLQKEVHNIEKALENEIIYIDESEVKHV